MIDFPHCKINLGLHITEKRKDGFHNLETIFIKVPIYDVLEIIVQQDFNTSEPVILSTTGGAIPGKIEENLCVKAWHLLKADFPQQVKPVLIHLIKHIPIGAGLGGGSSNGAFALKLLNKLFNLQLSQDQLLKYALTLGSDCPYFIFDGPCYATGRGEVLQPIEFKSHQYHILIINPGIHINTGMAFSAITPQPAKYHLLEVITQPIEQWQRLIINDFQQPIAQQFPIIQQLIDDLKLNGAIYAAMTGTGSTVFGLFHQSSLNNGIIEKLKSIYPHYFITSVPLEE